MKKVLLFISIAAMALSACDNTTTPSYDVVNIPYTDKIPLSESEAKMNYGLNKFGFDFFSTAASTNDIADEKGNIAVSPLSASIALSMRANSCDAAVENAVCKMLGQSDLSALNSTCQKLMQFLPHRVNGAQLTLANSAWYTNNATVSASWQNTLNKYYYSGVNAVDFSDRKTVDIINGWCNDQTNGLIPQVFDKVDPATVVMLANALYFSGEWNVKFNKEYTKVEDFYGRDKTVKVNMMHHSLAYESLFYRRNEYFEAVTLDFDGNTQIEFLLPIGRTATELAKELTYSLYCKEVPEKTQVKLAVPRFEVSTQMDLSDVWTKMGMPESCKFTKMGLDASGAMRCKQLTSTKIDEDGATLAAITVDTGLGTYPGNASSEKVDFILNKPFIYVVSNTITHTVIMAGLVNGF